MTCVTRMSDPDSVWCGADRSMNHTMTLCFDDRERKLHTMYHGGIRDGVFSPNDPSVPLPGWRP
jgi:hypothetical protein